MLALVSAAALAWNAQPLLVGAGSRALLRQPIAPCRVAAPRALAPAELWGDYLQLLETAPLVTKACTAGVIIGSGDAAAQAVEKYITKTGDDFDLVRVLRWGARAAAAERSPAATHAS
jgi:hypothetical protein